jgi:hypothetical protein
LILCLHFHFIIKRHLLSNLCVQILYSMRAVFCLVILQNSAWLSRRHPLQKTPGLVMLRYGLIWLLILGFAGSMTMTRFEGTVKVRVTFGKLWIFLSRFVIQDCVHSYYMSLKLVYVKFYEVLFTSTIWGGHRLQWRWCKWVVVFTVVCFQLLCILCGRRVKQGVEY